MLPLNLSLRITKLEFNKAKIHTEHIENNRKFATITFTCKEREGKARSTFLEQGQHRAATHKSGT